MKTKQHILTLLENGIHFTTISRLTESQIIKLSSRFNKQVIEEQSQPVKPAQKITTTTTSYKIPPGTDDTAVPTGGKNVVVSTKGNQVTVTPMEEGEITEKFASKSQQGLFYARCGEGKTKEEKKWCKMAKEFSDSTTKKDYKKMPEKLHPEKSVNIKKDLKQESYEKMLEDRIVEMIETHFDTKLTKNNTITEKSEDMMLKHPKKMSMFADESGNEMKTMDKPIGKLTSMGRTHMDENGTKEKEAPTTPGIKTPPKRKNPFKSPNPGVKEAPRGTNKEEVKMDFIKQIKRALY